MASATATAGASSEAERARVTVTCSGAHRASDNLSLFASLYFRWRYLCLALPCGVELYSFCLALRCGVALYSLCQAWRCGVARRLASYFRWYSFRLAERRWASSARAAAAPA